MSKENEELNKLTSSMYKLYDTTVQKYINKILIECGYFIREKNKKPILIINPFDNEHLYKFLLNICNIISNVYNYEIYIKLSSIRFFLFNFKNKIKVKRLKKKYNEEGVNVFEICKEFFIKENKLNEEEFSLIYKIYEEYYK